MNCARAGRLRVAAVREREKTEEKTVSEHRSRSSIYGLSKQRSAMNSMDSNSPLPDPNDEYEEDELREQRRGVRDSELEDQVTESESDDGMFHVSKRKRPCPLTRQLSTRDETRSCSSRYTRSLPPKSFFSKRFLFTPRSHSSPSHSSTPRTHSTAKSTPGSPSPSHSSTPRTHSTANSTPRLHYIKNFQCTSSSSSMSNPALSGHQFDVFQTPLTSRSESTHELTKHAQAGDGDVVNILGDISNTLNKIVKRLNKTDSRLENVEQKLSTSLSSSGSSSEGISKTKIRVPLIVRVCCSLCYYMLYYCMRFFWFFLTLPFLICTIYFL